MDVGVKPLKTKYPRSTTQSAVSGKAIGPQRRKLDAPVPWRIRSTAVPVPEAVTPLRLCDDAVRPAHPPGALREYDTAEPRTPLLQRLAVGQSKCPKRCYGLKERFPLPPSNRKRRISVAEQLEARGASIGGKPPHTLCPKDAPATRLHFGSGLPLLALELFLYRHPHRLRGMRLFERGRQGEGGLNGGRPLSIVRPEEDCRALDDQRSPPELVREHRDPGPVPGACHQAGLDRIGRHIGKLLNHRLLGQQSHDGALFVVPDATTRPWLTSWNRPAPR